jgi:rod shape-determining protein MreC
MRNSKLKIGITIFLLVVIFVVLNLTNSPKNIKNFFYLISSPFQKFLWKSGIKASDFFETIKEIKNLRKENEELKSLNQQLLAEITRVKELKKENEALRESLNIGLEKDFKLIISQIIGKDISQDSLIIDKGLKDGIDEGLTVITPSKTLVGKIGEVYEDFSKVILISNKESSFDAHISDTPHQNEFGAGQAEIYPVRNEISNGVYGVVKGKGNFQISFDLVPQEKELKEGDILVTSAMGGIFPEGILVGEIGKIKKSDIEPFQQAEIKPALDIPKLDFVFIIKH